METCPHCFKNRRVQDFRFCKVKERYPQTKLISKLFARYKRGAHIPAGERKRMKKFKSSKSLLQIPCKICKFVTNLKLSGRNLEKITNVQSNRKTHIRCDS